MNTIEVTRTEAVEVTWLHAECGVRYWEDATVNGVEDEDGSLIPCRDGDYWKPMIELATGRIADWPEGTEANIHYKVCDDGKYELHGGGKEVTKIEGYVPSIMSPGDNGYGDYVIMKVGKDGVIENWKVDLDDFKQDAA